jgi:hypothetical protein
LIGDALARMSRLPWIADFRDPMAQDDYPSDPVTWRQFSHIEANTIRHASRSVFVTQGAAAEYSARYPEARERIRVIENGYDEASFEGIVKRKSGQALPIRLLIVHSGVVYPSERDPTALFAALSALRQAGRLYPKDVLIRFRAPVHNSLIRDLAQRFHVQDFIEVAPRAPYRDALAELVTADALLVLQAANCNFQVPAKLYEYMRAGRPILGLTDPVGDTAGVMRRAGILHIAALEDERAIAEELSRFIDDVRRGKVPLPDETIVRQASRRERTAELASVLNEAIEGSTR